MKNKNQLPEEIQFNAEHVDFTKIFPGDELIKRLRVCKENLGAFNFWNDLGDQQNGDPDTAMLDLQSVGAVIQFYNALSDKNKKNYLDLVEGNPFVAAGLAWEIIGKIKSS